MSDEYEKPAAGTKPGVWRSRKFLLIAMVSTTIVLGLGLGVGLGVGLKRDSDTTAAATSTSTGTATSTATLPAYPSTTGNITNRTLWEPVAGTSWQIVLLDPIAINSTATKTTPDVTAWDIDLFTNTQTTINKLQALGKKVICYFSAGSYEPYRPDSDDFLTSDLGSQLDGWPGEYWLNTSSPNVRKIMAARIKLASAQGCDAIDPDNVDGYSNDSGLNLTEATAIDYMQFLASEASSWNMSCGLKNAGSIISSVINITHFSVNEQCVTYDECITFAPYVTAGKPVFHIEYPSGAGSALPNSTVTKYCDDTGDAANSTDFSTVLKDMNLDGWVEYCDETIATTSMNTTSS